MAWGLSWGVAWGAAWGETTGETSALVCEPLTIEGEVLTGEGETLLVCGPAIGTGMVFLGPLPTQVQPGEAITFSVFVVDAVGSPVSGAEVSLLLSGVPITTPAAQTTASAGSVSFTLAPLGDGALVIKASAGGIESLSRTVQIAVDPMLEVIEHARASKRKKGRIQPDKPSWQDIGPIAATPRPPPAPSYGGFSAPQQMTPGMQQLGQAMAQLAADQEAKLAAEVQAAQQGMEG